MRELETVIKSGSAKGAYYLYGADNYRTAEAFGRLCESIVPADDTLNIHSFQGKNIDIDEVVEACDALPVFAEKMLVTVCDLDLEVNKVPAAKLKPLIDEIENLPETTVLIFYTSTTDICGGKAKPTAANKKLFTAVDKYGSTLRFDMLTPVQTARLVEQRCSENGAAIERAAAELIGTRCRGDLNFAMNEADKLSSYSAHITKADVEMLTPENDDTKAYTLSDAIASGNVTRALDIYNRLIENRTDPIYLLYIVTGSINDIYRARLALDSRRSAENVTEDFGYSANMRFRVTNAFKSAQKTTAKRMRHCMEVLLQADLDMKTGKGAPETILENAIIRISGK